MYRSKHSVCSSIEISLQIALISIEGDSIGSKVLSMHCHFQHVCQQNMHSSGASSSRAFWVCLYESRSIPQYSGNEYSSKFYLRTLPCCNSNESPHATFNRNVQVYFLKVCPCPNKRSLSVSRTVVSKFLETWHLQCKKQ